MSVIGIEGCAPECSACAAIRFLEASDPWRVSMAQGEDAGERSQKRAKVKEEVDSPQEHGALKDAEVIESETGGQEKSENAQEALAQEQEPKEEEWGWQSSSWWGCKEEETDWCGFKNAGWLEEEKPVGSGLQSEKSRSSKPAEDEEEGSEEEMRWLGPRSSKGWS